MIRLPPLLQQLQQMTLKSSQRRLPNGFRIFRRFFLCANLRAVFKLEVRAPGKVRGREGRSSSFVLRCDVLRHDVAAALLWSVYRVRF